MLTTLNDVQQELRQTGAVNDAERAADAAAAAKILELIDFVSERIEDLTTQYFAPRQATLYEDAYRVGQGGRVDGSKLYLTYHLQSVDIIDNDGVLVNSGSYTLLPRSGPSYSAIRLDDHATWGYQTSDEPEECIGITGIWARGGQWVDTLQTISTELAADATTLAVTDVAAPDARLTAPAFSVGQLLRFDAEFLQVRAISGNTLSLLRGANGTSISLHEVGAAIETWYPDESIRRAATRWVTLLYKRRGEFATTTVEGMTEIRWPDQMPSDVAPILSRYASIGNIKST